MQSPCEAAIFVTGSEWNDALLRQSLRDLMTNYVEQTQNATSLIQLLNISSIPLQVVHVGGARGRHMRNYLLLNTQPCS
jgi:hypothetical protein